MFILKSFEKNYQLPKYKILAAIFHLLALPYIVYRSMHRDGFTLEDVLVTSLILAMAFYWKQIARVKKAHYEQGKKQ